MITIRTADAGWKEKLKHLLDRMRTIPSDVDSAVRQIIEQVRLRGDAALFEYTRAYDGFDPHRDGHAIGPVEIELAYRAAPREIVDALAIAAKRIEAFHAHQKEQSWFITEETGTVLGQKVTPVNSVGIYIPGG